MRKLLYETIWAAISSVPGRHTVVVTAGQLWHNKGGGRAAIAEIDVAMDPLRRPGASRQEMWGGVGLRLGDRTPQAFVDQGDVEGIQDLLQR
jgi:hypothetical protein